MAASREKAQDRDREDLLQRERTRAKDYFTIGSAFLICVKIAKNYNLDDAIGAVVRPVCVRKAIKLMGLEPATSLNPGKIARALRTLGLATEANGYLVPTELAYEAVNALDRLKLDVWVKITYRLREGAQEELARYVLKVKRL